MMRSIEVDYNKFCKELMNIEKFRMTTQWSYDLADMLLNDTPEEELEKIRKKMKPSNKGLSYSMADRKVNDVKLICEWVSIDEYAIRYNLSVEEVAKQAANNELGHVINEKEILYIIWPCEKQSNDAIDLPKLGKKLFNVSFSQGVSGHIEIVFVN